MAKECKNKEEAATATLPVDAGKCPAHRGRGRPRRYNFDQLSVDEYLYIPGKRRSTVASSIRAAQLRTGFKLSTVTVEDGIKVYRAS